MSNPNMESIVKELLELKRMKESLQEAHHKAALQEPVGRAKADNENMC